ncbi:MAG TPA: dihydroorotase, partial [Candidatus Binataceae bacterium]|nr:dihydroorotase [Candidatus Binataceae bacterium]
DAREMWVVPGLIDPHVHLRDPGFPEKETIATGLRAAAAGGFTAVAAMANTKPVNDNPEITRYMLERAIETHAARLYPVSAVTMGLAGAELVDFDAMVKAGARLFSDDGIPIDNEEILASALEAADRLGLAVSLHEEERELSCGGALNDGQVAEALGVSGYPNEAESDRIVRDLENTPRHCESIHLAHISTAESFDAVRAARERNRRLTCEVTPHHFTLSENAALTWGTNAKMNPPLRVRADVDAVRAAIEDDTVDMIASDHAPHDPKSKKLELLAAHFGPGAEPSKLSAAESDAFDHAANGVVGLETSLALAMGLVHQSVIDASRLVELMAVNPAELLGFSGYGLSRGAPADITIIDPNYEWTVDPEKFLSKSRNTPFTGMRLKGKAMITIVGGEIVVDGRRE